MPRSLSEILPEAPPTEYVHPPLAVALCQVRFSPVFAVARMDSVAPFQEAIRHAYPLVRATLRTGIQLVSAPQAVSLQQTEPALQWRFADSDGNWTAVLSPEYLALECHHYRRFSEFLERLHTLLVALNEHVHPRVCTRIGLRYVDEVRPTERAREWNRIVQPWLLGALAEGPGLSDLVTHTFGEIHLSEPDGRSIVMHHGLIPGGSVLPEQPERAAFGPFYLLDVDVSRDFPPHEQVDPDTERVCAAIDRYHDTVKRIFYASVTGEYVDSLEVAAS